MLSSALGHPRPTGCPRPHTPPPRPPRPAPSVPPAVSLLDQLQQLLPGEQPFLAQLQQWVTNHKDEFQQVGAGVGVLWGRCAGMACLLVPVGWLWG